MTSFWLLPGVCFFLGLLLTEGFGNGDGHVRLSSLLSVVLLREVSASLPRLGAVLLLLEVELRVDVTNSSAALSSFYCLECLGGIGDGCMCGCDLSEKRGVNLCCGN